MAVVVVTVLGTVTTTPAIACPQRLACVTTDILASGHIEAQPPTHLAIQIVRPTHVDLQLPFVPRAVPRAELSHSLATFAPPVKDELEMPWVWQVLRNQVYGRLPRLDQDSQDFTMVVSPVVVAGSFDTVPGFGVAGDF